MLETESNQSRIRSWILLQEVLLLAHSLFNILLQEVMEDMFNTFAFGLIQAVRAKTPGSQTALHGYFSRPVTATDPVKTQKTQQVLYFALKKTLVEGYGFVVSDIISGGLLGYLGPLHLALGPNC